MREQHGHSRGPHQALVHAVPLADAAQPVTGRLEAWIFFLHLKIPGGGRITARTGAAAPREPRFALWPALCAHPSVGQTLCGL